jgi:hypothetical protein
MSHIGNPSAHRNPCCDMNAQRCAQPREFRVGLKQKVRPKNAEIVLFSFSPDHFTWTRATPFTVLVASTGLPSGVTSILRTM